MFAGTVDEKLFAKNMQSLKDLCNSYYLTLNELEEKNASIKSKLKKSAIYFVDSYVTRRRRKKYELVCQDIKNEKAVVFHSPNYFSTYRIAVYTVVFGNYDKVREPVFIPDNCDFYIITDQEVQVDSIWKKIDISKFEKEIDKYTNKEKNLFFRTHPDLLFKNYDYSVYLDGNIMPITDLTELINYLSECGIGIFRHPDRQCIYDECSACMFYGKISGAQGERHIEYLEHNHMPHNYGLLETCVIARKHHLDICKKVMNDWWNEFMHTPRRDQLTFTYVLFKHGIKVDEVAFPCELMKDHGGVRRFNHV